MGREMLGGDQLNRGDVRESDGDEGVLNSSDIRPSPIIRDDGRSRQAKAALIEACADPLGNGSRIRLVIVDFEL